ncbi:MAG: c-type cytochrome [Nitrospirae bacterium]|nr:c-type cytochrome [Nitrospirota bacterium]
MQNSFFKAALFAVAVCAIYIYIGEVITDISGGAKTASTVAGISPEAGEAIFWGSGKCHTCHSVGDQGSAIRAPNLGVHGSDFPLPIALRAEERAKELSQKLGKPFTAADYLVTSHFDPGLYVVSGYKNEMPTVYKPPIALKVDQILAVDLYLQSLGGEPNAEALMKSPYFELLKKAAGSQSAATTVAFKPYLQGDPEKGKEIFFDPNSKTPCAKCHTVGDKGGKVGPELTNVAGTRDIPYIIQSILEPSAEIASGFEPFLIVTTDGEFITGVKKEEDDKSVTLADTDGQRQKISKDKIEKMVQQKKSIMPDNFRDLLTMDEFHNLLAFLETLQ